MKVKIHIINRSNCTLYIVTFFTGFDTLFLVDFLDFQNEATSLCVNNLINKDMKSYLSNPSWIFKIKAMEVVLWLI